MTIEAAKQFVNDNIKPNGTGAISGSIMNTALVNICDAVKDTLDAVDTALQEILG